MTADLSTDSFTTVRPGRLGDPSMTLGDDPRADPALVAALAAVGLTGHPEPLPVSHDSPVEQVRELCGVMETQFEALFEIFDGGTPRVPGVVSETVTIPGPDGGEITLFVHRPAAAAGPLPGMVHFHGGGMTLLRAAGVTYLRWRDLVAAAGMVVVGVEFRNAAGVLGPHAFPAGLNDCVTATRWVLDHARELGIGKVVLSGESGGGNLSLSVALRAKREGWVDRLGGVYALCPYISGLYGDPPPDLPSLRENDGYFLGTQTLAILAAAYDPGRGNADDPTCWPLRVTTDDLVGMPPHVISVNEVDPLRDEGLAYLRKLRAAGVPADGRVFAGTCHAAEVLLPVPLPRLAAATIRDIKAFADAL